MTKKTKATLAEADRLHTQAMELATRAEVLALNGQRAEQRECVRKAFELAHAAAAHLADPKSPEPSRSIIHRSAACLAFEAGDYPAVRQLVARALEGTPPAEVARELEAVRDHIPVERINAANAPSKPASLLALAA